MHVFNVFSLGIIRQFKYSFGPNLGSKDMGLKQYV